MFRRESHDPPQGNRTGLIDMWKNFPLFPERASALAWQVDGLYFFLVAVSAFFTLLIFAADLRLRRQVPPRRSIRTPSRLKARCRWS